MLENARYNLGRECACYARIPPDKRSKGGTSVAIKKEIARKRPNIRTILQIGLEVYLLGKRKRTI